MRGEEIPLTMPWPLILNQIGKPAERTEQLRNRRPVKRSEMFNSYVRKLV